MTDNLVVVYTAAGQTEANLIKSLLEAADIPAMIAQEGAGTALGLTVGLMGEASILVPAQYAEAARQLLAERGQGEASADADFTDS